MSMLGVPKNQIFLIPKPLLDLASYLND
jgi:hypothetical protein